jgi:hypothetical protein
MNGSLAQITALTCYGNAFIGGGDAPKFFPANSTCQFCDSINFFEFKKPLIGRTKEVEVAGTPDEWIASLKKRGAKGIRLVRQAQSDTGISDRMAAGFVGGGGTWMMEVMRGDGRSEFWAARWDVWNQDAPDRRIWRVTYGLLCVATTKPSTARKIAEVKADFRSSLSAIHRFSEMESCGGFTNCFAGGITALEEPEADIGYHKDLAPKGQLGDEARSLLKASMSAWVFGGMGSWNDMGFSGETQKVYESVSESLFQVLNEAIEVAATSTAPTEKIEQASASDCDKPPI